MSKPDRFSALPPELRDLIYDLLLTSEQHYNYTVRNSMVVPIRTYNPPEQLSLLSVSRQVRQEASKRIFSNNPQYIDETSLADLSSVADWLSHVVDLCGTRPFPISEWEPFIISVTDADCDNFELVLPLVEVMRSSGLRRDMVVLYGHHINARMDGPQWDPRFKILSVLEEALDLGRHAWRRGWTAEELEEDFWGWVEDVKRRAYAKRDLRGRRRSGK